MGKKNFFFAATDLISTKVTPSPGNSHMPFARLTLSFTVICTTFFCHKAQWWFPILLPSVDFHMELQHPNVISLFCKIFLKSDLVFFISLSAPVKI